MHAHNMLPLREKSYEIDGTRAREINMEFLLRVMESGLIWKGEVNEFYYIIVQQIKLPLSIWWYRRRQRMQWRWETTCWFALWSPKFPFCSFSLSPRNFYSSLRTHLNTFSSDAYAVAGFFLCHPHRHFRYFLLCKLIFSPLWFFFPLIHELFSLDFVQSFSRRFAQFVV